MYCTTHKNNFICIINILKLLDLFDKNVYYLLKVNYTLQYNYIKII